MNDNQSYGFILASFLVALILTVFPLPPALMHWRPDWMALILIYWCLMTPHRVGILSAWTLGFFVDAARGDLLGLNGLLLAIIAYFTIALHRRMRLFPAWKQALCVTLFIAVKLLVARIVISSMVDLSIGLEYWLPAITSGLCWPWVLALLQRTQRRLSTTI